MTDRLHSCKDSPDGCHQFTSATLSGWLLAPHVTVTICRWCGQQPAPVLSRITPPVKECATSPNGRHFWASNGDFDDICHYCGRHSLDDDPRRDVILSRHRGRIPVLSPGWNVPADDPDAHLGAVE